ncbi:hypothetical protein LTR12_016041 [Friedmanniomyces endolithicus]|nr:hypothetical protein LTR12_016041 [Friedmanniomyces endolithicus]
MLYRLPEELVQEVLERLGQSDLRSLQLVSRWAYGIAAPVRWREVELVDCRTEYEDGFDDHDDTPLIKVLLTLARKPELAACVQVLTHRCHLPPPSFFQELPQMPFVSQTLSADPRTISLIRHVVRNMAKLHTLRIVLGHPNLNDALLRCCFDKRRTKVNPVRRLWLENCRVDKGCALSLNSHPPGLPLELDFSGLESVRFRRLPLSFGTYNHDDFVYSRGSLNGVSRKLEDGAGSTYRTTVNLLVSEQSAGASQLDWRDNHQTSVSAGNANPALSVVSPLSALFKEANLYDRRIWEALRLSGYLLPHDMPLLETGQSPSNVLRSETAYRGEWLGLLPQHLEEQVFHVFGEQRETLRSPQTVPLLCNSASSTLRSLTFDWVLIDPSFSHETAAQSHWSRVVSGLFSLRLPHLRAFQLRNAVVADTKLPYDIFLLDHAGLNTHSRLHSIGLHGHPEQIQRLDTMCLEFMEAHGNLQCLAWPMEHFFSESGTTASADIAPRVSAVIDTLGRTLVDLRVDAMYSEIGELQSDTSDSQAHFVARRRRRRFIERFASKMTKLTSIKIEGGVPRDERREIIRALHACPLEKIVLIGVTSTVGNTWGERGEDLGEPASHLRISSLQGENKEAVWKYGPAKPEDIFPDFAFEANYGWPAGPPMLNVIAAHHASTVTELKFCGYQGAPALFAPTPLTTPLLSALKHFHKLERLVISLWFSTHFEGSPRDLDVISYWLNTRSPASTALVRVTDEQPKGWEKELKTKYAPDVLAWRITSLLGPLLSEQAKARTGGVNVRASFCLGRYGGIFDVDLNVGRGPLADVCLRFKGPREELEPERRRTKLDDRRWF